MDRIGKLEEKMRIILSNQFQMRKSQERRFQKIMDGFRAIERAFLMNCSKQIEMNEILDDYSSVVPGETVLKV